MMRISAALHYCCPTLPRAVSSLYQLALRILKNIGAYFKYYPWIGRTPWDRMVRNLGKAFKDHEVKRDIPDFPQTNHPLAFTHKIQMGQGYRKEMQDATFFREKEDHILCGVLDGHCDNGLEAAAKAAILFDHQFQANANMHLAALNENKAE